MSSKLDRKLRYTRERIVNAWGMLLKGDLKSMLQAVVVEFKHRWEYARLRWRKRRPPNFSKIPTSVYQDWRRVVPPSYRPTTSVKESPHEPLADKTAIGDALRQHLADSAVADRHKT